MDYFISFLFGLAVGSFANSVVYRLNEGGKIFSFAARSFCPVCKKAIAWFDLIPLVSFIVLRGKCRFCRAPISWWYAAGEVSGGIFFVFLWYASKKFFFGGVPFFEFPLHVFFEPSMFLITGILLLIIFLSDVRYYTIPDVGVLLLILLLLAAFVMRSSIVSLQNFAMLPNSIFLSAAGGMIAFLFFFSMAFFSRGKWMGWGDVKYSIFMGFVLGWPNILVGLLTAFVVGSLVGIGLIALKKKTFRSEIPFGAFLVPATLMTLVWGGDVWCKIWIC